jgi:hypothetical protein
MHDNHSTREQAAATPSVAASGRRHAVLFGVVILLGLAAFALPAARADVTLVRDGSTTGRIYYTPVELPPPPPEPVGKKRKPRVPPPPPPDPVADLVADLNHHFEKMSGATLEVVTTNDPQSVRAPAIVLGDLAVRLGAAPGQKTPSQECFRLLVKDGLVLVGGESRRAVSHGGYELLERLGCDWVMPGEIGEITPRRKTVAVPSLDESQAPDFLVRSLQYRGYKTKDHPEQPGERERMQLWLRRQKVHLRRNPKLISGGEDRSMAAFDAAGHVWDALIRRHKAAFEADPTMLALRKKGGRLVRSGPQIETTHPKVIDLFVAEIEAAYEKNIAAGVWTKDTVAAFSVGPADGLGYSMSPESLAVGSGKHDPIIGDLDRTDECILLANRILERVNRTYPNAHVGFYSYSTHSGYPEKHVPDPKIVQIFAPINFSRFHSVLDDVSPTQRYYRGVVERWGELARQQGNPLVYRGYSWNLAENMLPYTKVKIWGDELPFYKQQGFLGLTVEGTKMWSVLAASDYTFMKLAWDTRRDWRTVLRRFCEQAYGAGADAMERYNLMLIERQHGAGQEAGSYHAFHLIYDRDWVTEARGVLDAAAAAAKLPAEKERVGFVRHSVEALALYLDFFAATQACDFPAAKRGYDRMLAHWQEAYEKNSDLVSNEAPGYMKRYLLQFVDEALAFSSAPYRLVLRQPDELPTRFDEQEIGHGDGLDYEQPATDDSQWQPTKTYSTNWAAQGLAVGHRTGAVWYRWRFRLPADAATEPVGLFLGGFEDEARVWINGRFVGTSGVRFSVPAQFDLTDGIERDQENVLAIQVIRNSAANEIGLGGLIRPGFLFVGPRLEKPAPGPPTQLRCVLPGGELGELE